MHNSCIIKNVAIHLYLRHQLILSLFTQAAYGDLTKVNMFVGCYLKSGNHWTLVIVDITNGHFLYVDPKGHDERRFGSEFMSKFILWADRYNMATVHSNLVRTDLTLSTVRHCIQHDSRNCGIYTLFVSLNIEHHRHIYSPHVPTFASQHLANNDIIIFPVCQKTTARNVSRSHRHKA